MPASKRSGLVVDNMAYRSLGAELLNPDVTTAEFAQADGPCRCDTGFSCGV
ncbi:hypothetical protein [Micromonospora chersina]|uniref:hypothetical protein n=1 Tax=Micromonospora chersina TaxID=47854 RepID=UPI00371A0FDF